ncbi:helix-turn-helix domain-containing protein [Rhizobium metallidurans]|uniref:TniQ domain-containing protein n=1 Tax=Rhizobium metallidurans TaxID=1265931 RepID=A0A7W6CYE0_9HYPH|nr:helix-turn-helix domain-containing protein [Rhizobium metallidurans]MBB3967368.1 hypothetical protein [Rhizobium metallidurans]
MASTPSDAFSFYSAPVAGEAADGYILRRIGEEYHRSTRIYLDMVMPDHRGSFLVRSARLVEVMDMPPNDRALIERWSPMKSKGNLFINGQRLRPYQLRKRFRRFCPGCVEEAQFHRIWWDIASFRECPVHRTPLLEKNALGKRYVWTWPLVGVDRFGLECGVPMPRHPDEESFEYYMLQRFGVLEPYMQRPLLDGLHLDRVIDHCAFLGRLLSNSFSRKTPIERSGDWQAGFAALRSDRKNLENAVETWLLEQTTQDLRDKGADKAFGWARRGTRVKWLRQMPLLDAAIKVVLARTGRLGRGSLQQLDGIRHREITLTELADRYQLHKKGMRAVLTEIGVPVAAKGRFSYFDEAKVAAVDHFMKTLITEKEASAMLGCSRWTVWGLIQNKRIRGFSRIARRHAVRWFIPLADVEELMSVLKNLPVTGESHAVYSLSTFYAREAVPPYEIVERVLKGTLQIAAIDPTRRGMYSWRFHVLDMAKPARRMPRWKKPPVEYMTHVEACALTSFHPRTISHLAKAGVLEVPPESAAWLTRASVAAFHSQYVKAWLHREDLNIRGPAHLPEIIAKMGMTIYFRDDERLCEIILSRSELASALGARPAAASSAAEAVWQKFKASYESGYSAFHMPATIGTKPQRL